MRIRRRARWVAPLVGVMFGAIVVAGGCTEDTDRLSEDLLGPTIDMLADRTSAASLEVTAEGLDCAARRLSDDQANAMAADTDASDLPHDLAVVISRVVLDCVDADDLTRSAVEPFVTGASDASIDCVVRELNVALTESLITASLAGEELPAAQVELRLATALGLCLEVDELLDRG